MPATKKILPRAISLTVEGVGTRPTVSGKHSAYPKRLAAPATFALDGARSEVKRVSGSWQGERLEFIYWLQDGVARWTDITASEAAAIDAGKAVWIDNIIVAQADPAAEQPAPEPTPAPVATDKPKRQRRRVTAEA